MDEYVRLMAVNQLKWLNSLKKDSNINDELSRQREWLSQLNLSSKNVLPPTSSNSNFKTSTEPLSRSVKQVKLAKLSNKVEKKAWNASGNKNTVKSIRPFNVVHKNKQNDPQTKITNKEEVVLNPQITEDSKAIKRPCSSTSTILASPKNIPTSKKKSSDSISSKKFENKKDMDTKIEIENNKDLLNVSLLPKNNDKVKSENKPLRNEKSKNNTEGIKTEEKPKKEKHYDVKAARNFMKQKRNVRQQEAQLAKTQQNKSKDKSEIKKKLQELRNKQLSILKSTAKRKSDDIPDWVGLCSADNNTKPESSEPAAEKSSSKTEVIKPRFNKPSRAPIKKAPIKQEAIPTIPQPKSFFVDVNFPAEFLTNDRLGLTQEEVKQVTNTSAKKTKPISSKIPPTNKTSKPCAISKQPIIDDEANKIFQDEMKHGLEATNEFMVQVSQEMRLLIEHFKLINDSRMVDQGGRSIGVQSAALKDIAVQAFSSSLSESLHEACSQNDKYEWTDICPINAQENVKPSCNYMQKPNLLNELFKPEELTSTLEQNKNQDLSAVRRKLDFIEQTIGQENIQPLIEQGVLNKEFLSGLFLLGETENKIVPNDCLPLNEGDLGRNASSSQKLMGHSSLKHSQSKYATKPQDFSGESMQNLEKRNSDTTISESLSTDPLKLPEELSLNVEQLSDSSKKKGSVPDQGNIISSNHLEVIEESNKHFDVRLDTNSIDALQIKTSGLLESKQKRSNSNASRSFSEVSERISRTGSQYSNSFCTNVSKNNVLSQSLIEISEKLIKTGSGKSNISKINSAEDFKTIESIEECLQFSKSHSNSNGSRQNKKIKSQSDKSSSAREGSRSGKYVEKPTFIEQTSQTNQHELPAQTDSYVNKPKLYGSLEDIHSVHQPSPKSYSEKKLNDRRYYYNLSFKESERFTNNCFSSRENLMSDNNNANDKVNDSVKFRDQFVNSEQSDSTTSDYHEKNIEKYHHTTTTPPSLKKSGKTKLNPSLPDEHKNLVNTASSAQNMQFANTDSSSEFELLQPSTSANVRHRSSKLKRRSSSEKYLQEMFTDKTPFSSVSSNSVQISASFQDQIMKEMENLEAVNENLTHALARSRALSTENLFNFTSPSTSASAVPGVCDGPYYPLQPSQSDTTNNQSFGSSGFDPRMDPFNGHPADQLEDPSFNLSTFSLRMLENLVIDEKLRYRNQAYLINLRYQAVKEKTEAELTMLSVVKAEHKAKGNEEMLRNIKKRERGIILKCQQDFKEIKRLHEIGKKASRDRIIHFKSQINLLENHLRSKKYAQKCFNTSISKNLRKSGHSPSKYIKHSPKSVTQFATRSNFECQKRELERKEAMLAARRQSLEAVMTWTKRVEDEEKRLKDVEKLLTLSGSRQVIKEGVDRGTSPLNLVCDSEFNSNKVLVESSASSSEPPAGVKQNLKSVSDKSMDNYSDTFEQVSMSENIPQIKASDNHALDVSRRKSAIAIKVPLSPRCPPTKRRHSSGSDESILFSQNDTSETSDIEVRVNTLRKQLKQRKNELEILKRQQSKSHREKLRATEQALISQINAYDGHIEQLKNEIKQELDCGVIKVMKPQIKQPKVAERRKSEFLPIAEKRKEIEHKEIIVSEDNDLSESTESVKTLVESPRVHEDFTLKSCVDDSIKTDIDTQPSDENRMDSLELNVSKAESNSNDISELISKTLISDNQIDVSEKTVSDYQSSEVIGEDINSAFAEQHIHDSATTDDIKEPESEITDKEVEFESDKQIIESLLSSEHTLANYETNQRSVEECILKQEIDDLSTESSKNISVTNEEIEKESLKSDVSSVNNSEEIETESLLRSLDLSENKDVLQCQVDVTIKDQISIEEPSGDIEISSTSDIENNSSQNESIGINSSNIELLESSKLSNLDESPISSIHSSENAQLMSAALMRAIEATKEDLVSESEIYSPKFDDLEEENINETAEVDSEIQQNDSKIDLVSAEVEVNEYIEEIEEEIIEEADKDISLTSDKAPSPLLQMISDSISDSKRLWNLNLEEYRKIREETPYLSAPQSESDANDTIDSISQQLFTNLYERAITDVLNVYSLKKEAALKVVGCAMPEYFEEDVKEAEEEKFWCDASCEGKKETPSAQDEAEKLRLKQLQIEQEIEELEAAGMRSFYLREIPNKPPPPYTPPRPVKSRPTCQTVMKAIDVGINALWECDNLETLDKIRPPASFLSDLNICPDKMYRDMMWDLCVELYRKAIPPPAPPCPPWLILSKRKKLAPPPRSKDELIRWCTKQANIIFGFEPTVQKENMIIRWSCKKRDRVDEVLIREGQEEEAEWVDYTVEENIVKNRIADLIIKETIEEATEAIVKAFCSKILS